MNTLAVLAAVAAATPAFAQMSFSDDLTDGSFDPAFSYDFSSDSTLNGPGNDFNKLINGSGLCLCIDEVFITFPGVPEPVGLAQVDLTDFTNVGATTIEFIGTMGSLTFMNSLTSTSESFQVDMSDGIGAITSIRIEAFETFVTDIALRTIPAPGALGLLGVAGLAATRRRR